MAWPGPYLDPSANPGPGPRARAPETLDLQHDAQYDYYGRYLATCSSDGRVKVFECGGGEQATLATLEEHSGPVWAVCWGPPQFSSPLASASYDGKVVVYQESGGRGSFCKTYEYLGHKSSVNSIAWAPPQHGFLTLASCSSDSSIAILTYQPHGAWEVTTIPNAHQVGCNALAWEPALTNQPPRLASCGADNLLKIWARNEATNAFEHEHDLIPEGTTEFPDWVRDVAFCPSPVQDFSTLACCSKDKVYIWRHKVTDGSSKWSLLTTITIPDTTAWKLSWSEHDGLLAVTCADNTVYVYKNVNVIKESDWQQVAKHLINEPLAN
ncbi:Protein transport protein sec13 [Diplonema papillatum]|nr:Protein transport protein sec13 [Diplonema papillatum]